MHEHIKKLWVDALRSGNYRQGIGRLRCADTYCCLGVLCDLYDRDQGGPGWDDGDQNYLRCGAFLPREVARWAGIITDDPDCFAPNEVIQTEFNVTLPDHTIRGSLTDANDSGFSFLEIADLIEQNL
jgi:hypothetical protein